MTDNIERIKNWYDQQTKLKKYWNLSNGTQMVNFIKKQYGKDYLKVWASMPIPSILATKKGYQVEGYLTYSDTALDLISDDDQNSCFEILLVTTSKRSKKIVLFWYCDGEWTKDEDDINYQIENLEMSESAMLNACQDWDIT